MKGLKSTLSNHSRYKHTRICQSSLNSFSTASLFANPFSIFLTGTFCFIFSEKDGSESSKTVNLPIPISIVDILYLDPMGTTRGLYDFYSFGNHHHASVSDFFLYDKSRLSFDLLQEAELQDRTSTAYFSPFLGRLKPQEGFDEYSGFANIGGVVRLKSYSNVMGVLLIMDELQVKIEVYSSSEKEEEASAVLKALRRYFKGLKD